MRSTTVLLIGALLCVASSARACPFCSAQSQTLTEELNGADAAVLARLVGPVEGTKPAGSNPDSSPDTANRNTRFEIVRVLKGDKLLAGKKHIDVLYFGEQEPGTPFLMVAQDPKDLVWNTPTMLTARGVDYLPKLIKLPAAGSERMEFFLQHLEDEDPLLASDSYDEFARAPYADVTALKEKIDRPKLLGWIKSRDTSTSRRRLYLTLLGVCGKPEDLATLEGMIRDEDRSSRAALDALVACYLTLRGSEGLPLI